MSRTWTAEEEERICKYYDLYPNNTTGLIHDYFPNRTAQQLHDKYYRLRNSKGYNAVLERLKIKNGEASVIEKIVEKVINENKCVSCDHNYVCELSVREQDKSVLH